MLHTVVRCQTCNSKVRWITREDQSNGSVQLCGICRCHGLFWVSDELGTHSGPLPDAKALDEVVARK
jgi:hypothetical protein